MNTSPPILQDKWPFHFTSLPPLPLCSIKETDNQALMWFFGDTNLPSSRSVGFPNKVVFLASTSRLIHWPVVW